MHENSRKLTIPPSRLLALARLAWLLFALAALWGLPASRAVAQDAEYLGRNVRTERIDDLENRLTPDQVAGMHSGVAMPHLRHVLSAGYLHHTVWLRFRTPQAPAEAGPLWLLVEPTYLDSVTLYQPAEDGRSWRSQSAGDLVPAARKRGLRQPLFELAPGRLTLVRIQTTSAMQFDARLLTSDALAREVAGTERSMGLFFGMVLALLSGVIGAAAIFRTPALTGLALLGVVSTAHVFNVRGYASLWAPDYATAWASHAVGMGAFALAAALAWQIRVQLTTPDRHRAVRAVLHALIGVSLLGMASPWFGIYGSVAWINLASLGLCDAIAIGLCVAALRRAHQRPQHAVLLAAYLLHVVAGGPIALVLVGRTHMDLDITTVWQAEIFLFMVLVASATFIDMVGRYRRAETAKDEALERLEQSEHQLEERIGQRTSELSIAQAALGQALGSERTLRQEQRQFFQMISHEFRTPLAVIDSAAAEQWAFPSPALDSQTERAAQIRRACRRLTSLVDSCLVNDRMDAAGFTLHPSPVAVAELLEHAAQLVRWSPRHRLHLFTQAAPEAWVCAATLVRIALSNLVDNAVKYARAGEIFITAARNADGLLELSVADDGSGISMEVMHKMFNQFESGNRTDQTRGFGLGLWVTRRIAHLHGGDIQVESSPGRGTCFTLTIASQRLQG